MKSILLMALLASFVVSCSHTKKTTTAMSETAALNGTWELNYISGPRITFDGLYPDRKPVITFDVAQNRISGNTSCNNFTGPLTTEGNKINFNTPMAVTKMACVNSTGEEVFLETLKKITSWSVSEGNTLQLIMGDIAMMRFEKK